MTATEIRPYKYQRQGVRAVQRFRGCAILGDEVGLGKTPQSIWWFDRYLGDGPVVIVVPAGLKLQWKREVWKFARRHATVLGTKRPPRHGLPADSHAIYVINYEVLVDGFSAMGMAGDLPTWCDAIRAINPRLIICDEGHYCKNTRAKRTRAVRGLMRAAPHRLILTGTAIQNRPAELWSLLNLVRPDLWPAFKPFGQRYCKPKFTPWGWEYKGAERLDELHHITTETSLIRRLKKDVMGQLPTRRRVVVPVELPPAAAREYAAAESNYVAWLAKIDPGKARRAARAARLARVNGLKWLSARLKLPIVSAWVRDYLESTDGKLLLFAVQTGKLLHVLRDEFRRVAVLVDGGVTGAKRQAAVDLFNRPGSAARVFLGQLAAAGQGWSCTATSDTVFAELGWTPGEHLQAEGRAHGVGRGLPGVPATATYLVAANTVEADVCDLIQRKQRVLSEALDGDAGTDPLDLLDELEARLAARAGGDK